MKQLCYEEILNRENFFAQLLGHPRKDQPVNMSAVPLNTYTLIFVQHVLGAFQKKLHDMLKTTTRLVDWKLKSCYDHHLA